MLSTIINFYNRWIIYTTFRLPRRGHHNYEQRETRERYKQKIWTLKHEPHIHQLAYGKSHANWLFNTLVYHRRFSSKLMGFRWSSFFWSCPTEFDHMKTGCIGRGPIETIRLVFSHVLWYKSGTSLRLIIIVIWHD